MKGFTHIHFLSFLLIVGVIGVIVFMGQPLDIIEKSEIICDPVDLVGFTIVDDVITYECADGSTLTMKMRD